MAINTTSFNTPEVNASARAREIAFIDERRVGHLATGDAAGSPAVVPFCYAVVEQDGTPVVVSPLDEKPKRGPVRELGPSQLREDDLGLPRTIGLAGAVLVFASTVALIGYLRESKVFGSINAGWAVVLMVRTANGWIVSTQFTIST